MQQVRREQAGLRAFIASLGMRAEAVDDVAQEAFVIAFQKLVTFERGTNFGAWLRTIARLLVLQELRREDRRQRVLAEHVAEVLAELDAPASAGGPDHAAQAEALRLCLRELPLQGRDLVQRRYFENSPPAVIASQLGRTANDVRQALFRLRAALHACVTRRIAAASV